MLLKKLQVNEDQLSQKKSENCQLKFVNKALDSLNKKLEK
jgi:hypothetical protein